MKKVLLILVDGMRPDSIIPSGNEFARRFLENSRVTLSAQTVSPSVTLPCHMSLFHSVEPSRHGVLTNTYTPQVRPVNGLCEVLHAAKKTSAFFYNWEELKDLSRPDSLCYANFISGHCYGYVEANRRLTDSALAFINSDRPDFAFVYFGYTDAAGHDHGWMGKDYLSAVSQSFDCIERLVTSAPDEYTIIVTADHGGHERSHGTEMPEDMTIPLIVHTSDNAAGTIGDASILDIAPTAAAIIGVEPDPEWEGKVLPECI